MKTDGSLIKKLETLQKFYFSEGGPVDAVLGLRPWSELDLLDGNDRIVRALSVSRLVDRGELSFSQERDFLVSKQFLFDNGIVRQHLELILNEDQDRLTDYILIELLKRRPFYIN